MAIPFEAQLLIGQFREPKPTGRSLPRTTEASSGPCPATPCPATARPERSTKLAVVHGSENQLFGWLQNVGQASYPERTAVKPMCVDHCGAYILVVLTSLWPISSWMVRMSRPRSSRCVANEWRKVWQLAAFVTPASRTDRFTAFSRRSDQDGGGPGHRIPCRASGSAGGRPTATPIHAPRSDPFKGDRDGWIDSSPHGWP